MKRRFSRRLDGEINFYSESERFESRLILLIRQFPRGFSGKGIFIAQGAIRVFVRFIKRAGRNTLRSSDFPRRIRSIANCFPLKRCSSRSPDEEGGLIARFKLRVACYLRIVHVST